MKNTPVIFLFVIFLLFAPSTRADKIPCYWHHIDSAFDSVTYICEEVVYYDYPRKNILPQIELLYNMSRHHPQNKAMKARALYWDAWVQIKNNTYTPDSLLRQAFACIDSTKFPYDFARFRFLEGDIKRINGEWADAYRIYKQQEAFFTQQNAIFDVAKVSVAIGIILQELGESNEALKYYRKGNDLFEKIDCYNCLTKNKINISNTMYMLGEKEEALLILKELEQNPIVQQDTNYLVNVLVSLYSVSDKTEKGSPQKAFELAQKLNYNPLITLTLQTLGINAFSNNQPDSALFYFRKALNSAFCNNNVYQIVPILKQLSETHFTLNNIDSAYYYITLANTYEDSLLNQEKIIELSKLESKATIEKYEADLKQAHEKTSYQKRITWISVISIVILSCLIFYILWLSKRRIAIGKKLKEAENRELTLLNKQYLLELDSKNRELTSNTLIIAKKNAMLNELSQYVENLESKGAIDGNNGQQLKKHIKSQILADDEWQYFKLHFEKVHPDFFVTLKEKHPDLSETELRLCAYIRIGMSAKEIAQMLSIQPETVNTSRYRIRKKLKLASGMSLENYLRAL